MGPLRTRMAPITFCLLLHLSAALAQDFETDKKLAACRKANDLNTDLKALLDEYYYTKDNKKNAACLSACMLVDTVAKGRAVLQECESKSTSPEMKQWTGQLRTGAGNAETAMKMASSNACLLGCPRGLPAFPNTAQGVAARFRMEMVPLSAQDVKQSFVAMIQIFPKQYGWSLDKKPLAQYEEETYKCTYEGASGWAALKEKALDPRTFLIAALSFCLKETQGFPDPK
jgi:hypothetical protein